MKPSIIKLIALLFLSVATGTALKAQTENTGERLITQLKNGTAPGLLFSNETPAPAAATDNKLNQKESLIAQIKKGKAPGMQFKPVTGAPAPVMARVAVAAPTQPLPSEQAAAKPSAVTPAEAVLPKQE
jgi:hypothetical protein